MAYFGTQICIGFAALGQTVASVSCGRLAELCGLVLSPLAPRAFTALHVSLAYVLCRWLWPSL